MGQQSNGLQQAVQNFSNRVSSGAPLTLQPPSYGHNGSYDSSGPSLETAPAASGYGPQTVSPSQYPFQQSGVRAEDPRLAHRSAPAVQEQNNFASAPYPTQNSFDPYASAPTGPAGPSHRNFNDRSEGRGFNDGPDGREGRDGRDGRDSRERGRGSRRGGRGGREDRFEKKHYRDGHPPPRDRDGPPPPRDRDVGPRDSPRDHVFPQPEMLSGYLHYSGLFGRASKGYVPLFRPYPVNTSDIDACEAMHRFASLVIPLNLVKIVKKWTHTIELTPTSLEHPPVPLNTSTPIVINPSPMSSPFETAIPPPITAGSVRTEVRVLLLLGSPIDISAPKVGSQLHSNDKISFILFERNAESPEERNVFAPGGFFDPLLDSVSGRPSAEISDEELSRSAIRLVREQLSLDLSPCTKWYRFIEFEYTANSTGIVHRTVYVLPSIWDLIVEGPAFEAAWLAWKSEELKNNLWHDVNRLRAHLKTVAPNTPTYDSLSSRLTEKENELNAPIAVPPELAKPTEAPSLLLRTYSNAPGKMITASLTHLLQLSQPHLAELALTAHSFDEYLQSFFGTAIFSHLALMLAELTQNAAPLRLGSVLLTTRKRPHDQQTPSPNSSSPPSATSKSEKSDDTPEAKRIVKLEVKSEHQEEPHSLRPDAPSQASLDAQYHNQSNQNASSSGSGESHATEQLQIVPHNPGRPAPLMPQNRDYRLMHAFRYFDLNRLGFLRGEDCERILLTLGLGISRATAVDLAAAGDINARHHPNISSGYNPTEPLRYKPICDWLKSHGFTMPVQ